MAGIFEKLPMENSVTTSTLAERLRAIGDAKKVNPSPIITTPTVAVPSPVSTKADVVTIDGQSCAVVAATNNETAQSLLKEECPYCHRVFKYLERHRHCRKMPEQITPPSAEFVSEKTMPLKATCAIISTAEAQTEAPELVVPNVSLAGICHPVVRVFNPLDQLRGVIENIGTRAEGCEKEVINLLEHQAEVLRDTIHLQKETNVGTLCNQGYTLLLGCIPDGFENVIRFEQLIEPLERAVASENEVCHWSIVDYAKGAGYLATKLARLLVETPPQGILVVSDCGTASARACKDVLKRGAKQVIYGL